MGFFFVWVLVGKDALLAALGGRRPYGPFPPYATLCVPGPGEWARWGLSEPMPLFVSRGLESGVGWKSAAPSTTIRQPILTLPILQPPRIIRPAKQDSGEASRSKPLHQVMPDDHSKSVPPLPIPNRTVKRFYADDSAATSVKVGHRQASYNEKTPHRCGVFFRLFFSTVPFVRPNVEHLFHF